MFVFLGKDGVFSWSVWISYLELGTTYDFELFWNQTFALFPLHKTRRRQTNQRTRLVSKVEGLPLISGGSHSGRDGGSDLQRFVPKQCQQNKKKTTSIQIAKVLKSLDYWGEYFRKCFFVKLVWKVMVGPWYFFRQHTLGHPPFTRYFVCLTKNIRSLDIEVILFIPPPPNIACIIPHWMSSSQSRAVERINQCKRINGWLVVGISNVGWVYHSKHLPQQLVYTLEDQTWNLQITHLERKMIFQTSMIMFQPLIFQGVPFEAPSTTVGLHPGRLNMEPTNHPFRKEHDLPNFHDYVPAVNLPGRTIRSTFHNSWFTPWKMKHGTYKSPI